MKNPLSFVRAIFKQDGKEQNNKNEDNLIFIFKEMTEIRKEISNIKVKLKELEQNDSNVNDKIKHIYDKLNEIEIKISTIKTKSERPQKELTPQEREVLRFVEGMKEVRVKDIQERFDLPKSTASTILKTLKLKGYIEKVGHGRYKAKE